MIRIVFALRRQPRLSLDAFQAYWRDQHGPLVAGHAGALNILRYVQTHRLDEPGLEGMTRARGEMEPPHDGVAELWWESETALASAMATPAGQAAGAALLEDEQTFIDLPNSPLWFAHEYPQVNPTPETVIAHPRSTIARVFFPLRQRADMDDAAARRYWLTEHGPIVRRGAQAAGILCYRQVHRTDHPLTQALREARGTRVDPYLGHAEAWTDRARASQAPESKAAGASFINDERNFIDFARSTIWLGKEHTFIDRR
ncbi:MAG: EthD domain-containing protein [Gammaproteobacteria bacterium]|nr:EthD domain-containing protein [Gammaproteobacteria bacterium]